MLVFWWNSRSDIWPYFIFSVIYNFKWLWTGSLHKNTQLMLEFLKAPFLVINFSYYTLITFLMMLSVILLSMLMILLFIQGWQQLELASELESDLQDTVDWGKKWLVDFLVLFNTVLTPTSHFAGGRTNIKLRSWDTSALSQVSNCDGVVLENYLNNNFQWPQEGLNCEPLVFRYSESS